MASSVRRFGITSAFLYFPSILPATVGAQPPAYLLQWGSFGSGNGHFSSPVGVATDVAGNVYVADIYNCLIQKFTSTGTFLTQWSTCAWWVATDATGDVYVVVSNGNFIQKFTGT